MLKKVYFLVLGNFFILYSTAFKRLFDQGIYHLGAQRPDIAKIYWMQALACKKLDLKRKQKVITQLESWCDLDVLECEAIKKIKEEPVHAKRKNRKP